MTGVEIPPDADDLGMTDAILWPWVYIYHVTCHIISYHHDLAVHRFKIDDPEPAQSEFWRSNPADLGPNPRAFPCNNQMFQQMFGWWRPIIFSFFFWRTNHQKPQFFEPSGAPFDAEHASWRLEATSTGEALSDWSGGILRTFLFGRAVVNLGWGATIFRSKPGLWGLITTGFFWSTEAQPRLTFHGDFTVGKRLHSYWWP